MNIQPFANALIVLNEMTSGGASLNDSFIHGSINTVPFGGVGDSGWGNYRGKASFDCFTHFRTVAETPSWVERFLRVRYMPYQWSELKLLQRFTHKKPNFNRNGAVVKGLGYWTLLDPGARRQGPKRCVLALAVRPGQWLCCHACPRRQKGLIGDQDRKMNAARA